MSEEDRLIIEIKKLKNEAKKLKGLPKSLVEAEVFKLENKLKRIKSQKKARATEPKSNKKKKLGLFE